MTDSHGGGGGISAPVILGALICAAVTAILADLMTPFGPVVLTLGIAFAGLTIFAGILSLLPPLSGILRPVAAIALINTVACGAMIGLWYLGPKPAVTERGVIATMLPFGKTAQTIVVRDYSTEVAPAIAAASVDAPTAPAPPPAPLTPAEKKQQTLLTALASADPAVRLRGGVTALTERDPAMIAGVIDTLYRSPDPAVRQLAVKRLLNQRRGARMPLIAVAANADAQAFANALQGGGLTIRALNETSGVFDGALCAPGMSGAVNRSGVTLSAKCKTGATDGTTVLVLQATDDYKLVGEARNDQGQTAKVEVPLM